MHTKPSSAFGLVLELFGWIGTFCLLGAFFANSFQYITVTDPLYQILNLIGGMGIASISIYKRAWQPAVVNAFWMAIAILSIGRLSL